MEEAGRHPRGRPEGLADVPGAGRPAEAELRGGRAKPDERPDTRDPELAPRDGREELSLVVAALPESCRMDRDGDDEVDRPADGAVKQDAPDRFFVIRPIGKKALPDLKAGPAKIVVRASRPVLRGLRTVSAEASKDVQVRLEPPAVAVLSQFHYVNLGGAEFVVYRATPADVEGAGALITRYAAEQLEGNHTLAAALRHAEEIDLRGQLKALVAEASA